MENEILKTATTIEFEDYSVTRGNSYYKWFVYTTSTKTPQTWGFITIQNALDEIPKLRQQQIEWHNSLVDKGIIREAKI